MRFHQENRPSSIVVGLFEGVGEVGRERPVLFGLMMLAGPGDREGSLPASARRSAPICRVAHVEPDLASEAACLGPLLGRRLGPRSPPTAWRRHGRTRRAPRRSCRRRAAGRRPAPGGSPRGRAHARLAAATAIEWRRSAPFICCQSSRSFGQQLGIAPTPCRPARVHRATATRRSACSDGRTPLVTPLR